MSNKLKIVVFSVTYWNDTPPFLYEEWKKRVDKHIKYDHIFLSPGTYSDPKVLNDDIEVVQINLPKTKQYNKNWSYFHSAFLTAIYNLLINIPDFDVAIHVQGSLLLNKNLNDIIEEFSKRDEILACPKFTSEMGCYLETSLMMIKKEAALKYATQPLRPSLSEREQPNVEEEAFYMFYENFWNFCPEITSIRKIDTTVAESNIDGPFCLSDNEFFNLPFIITSGHARKSEIERWIEKNPV